MRHTSLTLAATLAIFAFVSATYAQTYDDTVDDDGLGPDILVDDGSDVSDFISSTTQIDPSGLAPPIVVVRGSVASPEVATEKPDPAVAAPSVTVINYVCFSRRCGRRYLRPREVSWIGLKWSYSGRPTWY